MSSETKYLRKQPWIYHPAGDALFVLAPPLLITAAVLLFPGFFESGGGLSPLAWLILIVGIDVSHVYSTLYRTYFDKSEFRRYRRPLILIPLLAWGVGALLHFIGPMAFWTVLAYLAVYHFVRQQYGFFAIYARKQQHSRPERLLDQLAIYGATVYPLIYWHTHLPRKFNWFVQGDFLSVPYPIISTIAGWVYLGILAVYVGKEIRNSLRNGLNFPKNIILIGTCISWYTGIVMYEGDLAFTATNVISHGIPYMALVWFYGKKKAAASQQNQAHEKPRIGRFFQPIMLPVFVGLLFLLGYVEEGMWDGWIWGEHAELFPWTQQFSIISQPVVLALVVPLLAVPQVTHYVIDGFIWRMRKKESELKEML